MGTLFFRNKKIRNMKDLQMNNESRKSSELNQVMPKNTPVGITKKITKKFNLTIPQIESKIQILNDKLPGLEGAQNKKRRANVFAEIVKLRKALAEPENFLIDGEKEKKAIADRKLRIQKKLDAKRKKLEEKIAKREAERKKAKNALRDRRKHCLYCKKYGHTLHECTGRQQMEISAEMCYGCGSTQYSFKDCPICARKGNKDKMKFATCFICHEVGHISKDCPRNENGIYPYGGGCYFCGDKMHKKADCPDRNKHSKENKAFNGKKIQTAQKGWGNCG